MVFPDNDEMTYDKCRKITGWVQDRRLHAPSDCVCRSTHWIHLYNSITWVFYRGNNCPLSCGIIKCDPVKREERQKQIFGGFNGFIKISLLYQIMTICHDIVALHLCTYVHTDKYLIKLIIIIIIPVPKWASYCELLLT